MNGRKFNQAVFERDDEKKKQEIIYERIWILGGLWRVIAYEYSSFIFLFFLFSIETVNENAPMSFLKMLWNTMFFLAQTSTDVKTLLLLPAEYRHHF